MKKKKLFFYYKIIMMAIKFHILINYIGMPYHEAGMEFYSDRNKDYINYPVKKNNNYD